MAVFIIEGVMEDGRKFRPSDWVERLSAALGSFGSDHRLRYGRVRPFFLNGEKCLQVEKCLEDEDPVGFEFVRSFARANGLRISEYSEQESAA